MMDTSNPQNSTGWLIALAGAIGTAITWFFSHFATAKELKFVNERLDKIVAKQDEMKATQDTLFSNQAEYRKQLNDNAKVMKDVDGLFRNFQVSKWFKRLEDEANKE